MTWVLLASQYTPAHLFSHGSPLSQFVLVDQESPRGLLFASGWLYSSSSAWYSAVTRVPWAPIIMDAIIVDNAKTAGGRAMDLCAATQTMDVAASFQIQCLATPTQQMHP